MGEPGVTPALASESHDRSQRGFLGNTGGLSNNVKAVDDLVAGLLEFEGHPRGRRYIWLKFPAGMPQGAVTKLVWIVPGALICSSWMRLAIAVPTRR